MAEQNTGLPADRQLWLRIGLNLGDVIIDGEDIFGTGVNVAARLEALAEPGGIVVAGAVRDQTVGTVDVAFADRGLCRVKNIAEPIRVFAVAGSGGGNRAQRNWRGSRRSWRWALVAVAILAALGLSVVLVPGWRATIDDTTAQRSDEPPAETASVGKPVVAVLPFGDRGGAGDPDYFSDGVTEDVIRALGRFSALQVLSWSAVAPFKGQAVDLDAVSEELGARYVVGGTIQRAGEQLRVSVELSDAARGVLLWSERYDEPLADIFAVQDRITRQVVAALAVRVTQVEREVAHAKPTESLGAYDLVLHGRDLLRKVERDANYDARAMFERAIAIDPRYADAHVGLGWTHLREFLWGWTQWPHRAVEKADEAAARAIELEDRNAAGQALRAFILTFQRDFATAEAMIDRALSLNPNDALSHAIRGNLMMTAGRPEATVESVELALELDPHPRAWWLVDLGQAYYLAGRYGDVIALFDRFIGNFDEDPAPFAVLAAAHAQLGNIAAAESSAAQLRRVSPFFQKEIYVNNVIGDEHRRHLLDGMRKAGL
jgi:TolB-like protein